MKNRHSRMMCASIGATVAIIGGAAPAALAQQQDTTIVGEREVEEGRRVLVSYRDLNLSAATEERRLYYRVKAAARQVCQPNDDQLVYRPFSTCVSVAWDGALPQVDLAVRRAREIAFRGTSSIPLVAIAVVGVR